MQPYFVPALYGSMKQLVLTDTNLDHHFSFQIQDCCGQKVALHTNCLCGFDATQVDIQLSTRGRAVSQPQPIVNKPDATHQGIRHAEE